MKIEKQIKCIMTLDSDEISILRNARQILEEIENKMSNYHCDIIKCCDEYTYDISELRTTIGDLEMFENITEISNWHFPKVMV